MRSMILVSVEWELLKWREIECSCKAERKARIRPTKTKNASENLVFSKTS